MFKIIGADDKEYGPVSFEQLRDWVAQGRVTLITRIQISGSAEWRPAKDVPELAALFSPNERSQTAPPALPAQAPKVLSQRKGMAVASFILGLFSLVPCVSAVTSLPAIIFGHVARSRARKLPQTYGGRGLALAGTIFGYIGMVVSVILLLLILPAASRNRPGGPPPLNDCQNNLRQIGLAFKVWALEHNDQYPFNVSTNAGGSLELCSRGADGFEKNLIAHFLIISNDLSITRFLVCPQDKVKRPASDFSSLSEANLSYRLRTGTNINADNPGEILAVCPIHGYVLFCDGNVRKRDAK